MKTKRKRASRPRRTAAVRVSLAPGMSATREVPMSRVRRKLRRRAANVFTPMETGALDQDLVPGARNPMAMQGGVGPMNQEGEGDRQNDDLDALERVEPDL
jgi:hypothetical protein